MQNPGVADYTIRNLKDVEDSALKFGLSPGLEGRFASGDLGMHTLGVSYQRLAPGFRIPFGHSHPEQEEVYVVLAGSGRVRLGDEVHDVGQWDAVRIGPSLMHGVEAGPDGLELLAFGAPGPLHGDAEMVQGWWSD